MEKIPCFNQYIQKSIIDNWDRDAFTDFKGQTLQYHDVARLRELRSLPGVKKVFLTFEGRAGNIMDVRLYNNEFTADQIHNIVNHSEAKLLFVGDVVATEVNPTKMPMLEGIIYIPDYSLVISRTDKLTYAREHLNEMFGKKYPKYFRKEHVKYYMEESPEEMALINYTSGTTGFSKGVMIPYRAMWSNFDFAVANVGPFLHPGDSIISILPMAHMYGMAFEFMFEFLTGCHVYYLTRVPSPAIIAQSFSEIKPKIIISVPLIIEKIIKKKVFPKIQNNRMRLLLNMPIIKDQINEKICDQVSKAFGGSFYEIIIGGAAFNQEVERFLRRIKFHYTVGYGATECAPIIAYADYKTFVPGSSGRAALHMQVKIDSKDPAKVPGEILCKGPNVMLGYYKNEEATKAVIDSDGWFHTGDLGTMDAGGNIFIKGRSKNMLLGSNGQNIYPEEIEDALNSQPMVVESVVVQRQEKLYALVYPDFDLMKNMGFNKEDLKAVMEQNRQNLNAILPVYSKIAGIEIHDEEFAKTPKRSIKRYLYS